MARLKGRARNYRPDRDELRTKSRPLRDHRRTVSRSLKSEDPEAVVRPGGPHAIPGALCPRLRARSGVKLDTTSTDVRQRHRHCRDQSRALIDDLAVSVHDLGAAWRIVVAACGRCRSRSRAVSYGAPGGSPGYSCIAHWRQGAANACLRCPFQSMAAAAVESPMRIRTSGVDRVIANLPERDRLGFRQYP